MHIYRLTVAGDDGYKLSMNILGRMEYPNGGPYSTGACKYWLYFTKNPLSEGALGELSGTGTKVERLSSG